MWESERRKGEEKGKVVGKKGDSGGEIVGGTLNKEGGMGYMGWEVVREKEEEEKELEKERGWGGKGGVEGRGEIRGERGRRG